MALGGRPVYDEGIRRFFNRDAEPKQYLDNTPISCKTLGEIYGLDGKKLQKQYVAHLSNFSSWKEADHPEDWLLFPENMGEYLSIDETRLSQGSIPFSPINLPKVAREH